MGSISDDTESSRRCRQVRLKSEMPNYRLSLLISLSINLRWLVQIGVHPCNESFQINRTGHNICVWGHSIMSKKSESTVI